MHAPRRPTHSPIPIVMLATIPLVLAAITVWMVRDALAHDGKRHAVTPAEASAPSSPSSISP